MKVTRIFHQHNSIQALYDYIESFGILKDNEVYEVVSVFPRRIWKRSINSKSLFEEGIKDSDTLYVQAINIE